MTSYKDYLKEIYFDPSHPASFSGPEKLYKVVKQEGKFKIGRHRIKQWLQDQDEYSLQRGVRRRFKRRRVVTSGIDSQWDVDLASVENISKYNDGISFLLICIDVFSRHVWVEPLKDKKAKTVIEGLEKIFAKGRVPESVRSDKGSELVNRWMTSFLKKHNIKHFVTQNEVKANYAERVIRTLKAKMYRMFQKKKSYRYLEQLQQLVNSYNNTHRSLGYISPNEVNKSTEAELWKRIYVESARPTDKVSKRETKSRPTFDKFRFKIGDLVRVSHLRQPFTREYQQKWTSEIFKVSNRFLREGIPVYKLKDFLDEQISGSFYGPELLKVRKDQDALWNVEKILKKRKRKGQTELLVKFEGWPSKFNSWIPEKDIESV